MFTENFDTNLKIIKNALRSEKSFDLIERNLILNEHRAVFFFVDGFLKDDIAENFLNFSIKT